MRLGALPLDFNAFRADAKAEGFAFLRRLNDRWRGGGYDADTDAASRRRLGVGRALASDVIGSAFALTPRLHFAPLSAFCDAMGFMRVDWPDRSHELARP